MRTYRVPVMFQPGDTSSLLCAYVTLPAPPWDVDDSHVPTAEAARRRVAAGESIGQVARDFGVSNSTVRRLLGKLG